MYCGNCGKVIKDGDGFCAECKALLKPEQQKVKQKSKRLRKIGRIGISLIVIGVMAVIGLKLYGAVLKIPTDKQMQTAINNSQNGGLVATDGKWLYYNDVGLCKVRFKDLSKHTVVVDDIYVEDMFYAGDSLYYYSRLKYHKIDDTEITQDLEFTTFANKLFWTDGKKYYVTNQDNIGGLYSRDVVDVKELERISDIYPSKFYLYKDSFYIVSSATSINGKENKYYGTWKMDKKGGNLVQLFDFCPALMVFSGEEIYYINDECILCSTDLNGTTQRVYDDVMISRGLNVSDEYIFYIDYRKSTIFRINKDGGNKIELNQCDSDYLNILGDWIFYKNIDDDSSIYKMSFDGSYNESIY